MNFLQYSLSALISYLGLIIGIIVMYCAKEEQKAGKKYFQWTQTIIVLLICVLSLYFKLQWIIALTVILIIFILFMKNIKVKSYYLFPTFGILFFLSSMNQNLLLYQATLIFLYGMVTSSPAIDFKKKNYLQIFLGHISFLIISILLFSVSTMF